MGASSYASMGTGISGDIVGGIGQLIMAQNYKKPKMPPATGPELRLRQLAQSQLLGGGQELLGGTALYTQLAPILLSQLPGMHYVPGGSGGGGIGNQGASGSQVGQTADPTGAQTSPMASYQQALQNYQQQQALQQQKQSMKAQLTGMTAGPAKKALRQQLHGVRRALKAMPDAATLERQNYMAGAQPGSYDIRMGPAADTSGGMGPISGTGAPTGQTSLGSINDLMNPGGSYLNRFQQAQGGGYAGGDQGMQRFQSGRIDPSFSLDLDNPAPGSMYQSPLFNNAGYRDL